MGFLTPNIIYVHRVVIVGSTKALLASNFFSDCPFCLSEMWPGGAQTHLSAAPCPPHTTLWVLLCRFWALSQIHVMHFLGPGQAQNVHNIGLKCAWASSSIILHSNSLPFWIFYESLQNTMRMSFHTQHFCCIKLSSCKHDNYQM